MFILEDVDVDILLETGAYGNEVSWSLDTTCTSEQTYSHNSEYTKTCNLSPGEYTLVCTDSYGDGWNGAQIIIQGVKYCDTFNQGSEMLVQLTITSVGVMPVTANGNDSPGKKHYSWCFLTTQPVLLL